MPAAVAVDQAKIDTTLDAKTQIQKSLRAHFPRDVAIDFKMMPGLLTGNTLTVIIVKGSGMEEQIYRSKDYIAERLVNFNPAIWPNREVLEIRIASSRMSSEYFYGILKEFTEDPKYSRVSLPQDIDSITDGDRNKSGVLTAKAVTSAVPSISSAIQQPQEVVKGGSGRPIHLVAERDDSPTHRVIKDILNAAIAHNTDVSDIHFEPGRNPSGEFGYRIRFRELNDLRVFKWLPDKQGQSVVSALTHHVEGGTIDFTQLEREIQDGRLVVIDEKNERIPLRVNSMPIEAAGRTAAGLVLRVLRNKSAPTFDKIGFDPAAEKEVLRAIHAPYGIVLVVGPTSSGKTTTLYSCLGELNTVNRKLCTIEEPPEYALPGAEQVHAISTNPERTFAKVLRGMMRRNPNVILVGEIRDKDTADAAIDASITGHVVFSTLHTHDTPSTLTRLSRMGIPPFQLESQLRLIIAQRLLRKINPQHFDMRDISVADINREYGLRLEETSSGKITIPIPKANAPEDPRELYSGRFMIYELLPVTPAIGNALAKFGDRSESIVRKKALKAGYETLFQCGFKHVLNGNATLDDLLNVTRQ